MSLSKSLNRVTLITLPTCMWCWSMLNLTWKSFWNQPYSLSRTKSKLLFTTFWWARNISTAQAWFTETLNQLMCWSTKIVLLSCAISGSQGARARLKTQLSSRTRSRQKRYYKNLPRPRKKGRTSNVSWQDMSSPDGTEPRRSYCLRKIMAQPSMSGQLDAYLQSCSVWWRRIAVLSWTENPYFPESLASLYPHQISLRNKKMDSQLIVMIN